MPTDPEPGEPLGFDPTTPSIARMYDYFLGGKDNFAADRAAADKILEIAPEVPLITWESRKFLGRVVRFLVEAGIDQFIDIGTGLPTQGHVHQILRSAAPGARVAYVDNDPIVALHAQALLKDSDLTTVVQADLRDPDGILGHPEITGLIDLGRPFAILLMSVVHFVVDDDEAHRVLARLRAALAPGGYLALSHAVGDPRPDAMSRLGEVYREGPMKNATDKDQRTRSEIVPFFDGLDLVDPGVVYVPAWRPDPDVTIENPESVWVVGGVARKPGA